MSPSSYNAIAESLEKEDYDDGSMGPVLLRLAWCVPLARYLGRTVVLR